MTNKEKDLGGDERPRGAQEPSPVRVIQLTHTVRVLALRELLRVQEAYASTSPMKNRGVSALRMQALTEAIAILEAQPRPIAPMSEKNEHDEALIAGCRTGLLAAHSLACKKQRLFEPNMGAWNALGQLIVEIEALLGSATDSRDAERAE